MESKLPLAGVVVVELSDNASLPYGGQVLAALGADVWKIERPGGDATRTWGPSKWRGCGAAHHAVNRGKKSICVDIKDPAQLRMLHDLIDRYADVFIHNLRPGSAAQYGLDPDSLRARKPDLICTEIGAFGHVGPMNKDPGYDPLMQAFAGIMSVTGEEGRPPVRAGIPVVDFGTGMWAVIGTLAALYRRKTQNIGATVNASLFESALAWMSFSIANYAADGEPGSRHGSGVALLVPHGAYTASDGYLVISCSNERLFARLCDVLGRPEWMADPRYSTNMARLAHRAEIEGLLNERLATDTRANWKKRLDSAGIACAPTQTVAEVYGHEQTRALGILGKPADDEIALVGLPLSFDRERPPPLHSAPDVGQHDADLRRMLKDTPLGPFESMPGERP